MKEKRLEETIGLIKKRCTKNRRKSIWSNYVRCKKNSATNRRKFRKQEY